MGFTELLALILSSVIGLLLGIIFIIIFTAKRKNKALRSELAFYKNMKPLEIKQSKKNIRTLIIQKMYPKNEPLPLFETDLDKIVENEIWCEFSEELRKYMKVDIRETNQGIMRYRAEFDVVEDEEV